MKQIMVFLAFLLFAMTGQDDSMEDYPPSRQYDKTEAQINAIIELLQGLDKRTIKKKFDEWILQNQTFDMPSIIVNSEKITFTKFISDEDIIPISSLSTIYGYLNSKIWFEFAEHPKIMQVDGSVECLPSRNHSSCQMSFSFHFELTHFYIEFENPMEPNVKVTLITMLDKKNFTNVEWDDKSCKDINEEGRRPQAIHDDISTAVKNGMIERIKFIKKSVFQSILNKWIYPDNNFYARGENDYSRFESHNNIGTFPWLFDHNKFIINGLTNFEYLSIGYLFNGETTYNLYFKDVKIRWNIASVVMMQRSYDAGYLLMEGSINELLLMKDLEISLTGILEVINHDYITEIDEEFVKKLQVQIANGIKQTTQKIRCDNTEAFINVIREILRSFDEKLFKRSLVDLEKNEKNFPVGTISILKLDVEAFQLKNITWSNSDKLEVGGTLRYEKIECQSNILLPIVKDKVHGVPISVNLSIQQATFGISLKHSNSSNDDEMQIEVDWNDVDTIIMITSSYYHLSRQERIEIGKQTFQYFIETIGNQIIEVTKSTFRPIFDIYKNLFNSSTHTTGSLENFDNQQRYFAVIHDYWTDTTESSSSEAVEIIIDGLWNFKPINIQYIDEKLFSIGGLQLENVTANIKQYSSLNNSVTTNYTTNSISITINHMENDVIVHLPSYDQNMTDIIGKLESTIASFIGYSIYDNLTKDSNYHANFRKLVNKTTTKVIQEDTKVAYNASSQFANNFVRILKDNASSFYTPVVQGIKLTSMSSNCNYISNETTHQIEPLNVSLTISDYEFKVKLMDSLLQEEICVYSNNLSNIHKVAEQFIITGKINMWRWSNGFDVIVSFLVNSSRVMNIFNNYSNETAQIYIDDKNIEDIFKPVSYTYTPEKSAFDPNNKTLKTELALLASSFLHGRLKEIPSIDYFCKLGFNSTKSPEKHFFSISGPANNPSELFSTYYIKLYGLNNFKMLRRVYSETVTEFEIMITNSTARIIWNHYNGDYIRRTPKIMNLQIDEIILCAKVSFTKRLIFTKQSRMLVSDRENSTMAKMAKEKIEEIVINGIQQAIQQEYDKINRN